MHIGTKELYKLVPSGGSREESIFLPFLASRGCTYSLASDPDF